MYVTKRNKQDIPQSPGGIQIESAVLESETPYKACHWANGTRREAKLHLLGEEPLSIRIQGKPYAVIMRTPGDEIAHAAGFCLSEGIVDRVEDFANLGFCDEESGNVVTVTLKPSRSPQAIQCLDRHGYISQTSCGICGKEVISDLAVKISPLNDDVVIELPKALPLLESLYTLQPLRESTKSSHVAALFNTEYELLSMAEDVGRHNALDKAIGKLFLGGKLNDAVFMILSSRLSYELVQKAGRAKIPVILSKSRPTNLAVSLSVQLNLTLACQSRESGVFIFCGGTRLKG
jgi:FdhD protein